MEVRTREDAWIEANRLFPTDYMKDERSSQNAGYPIYESTSSDNRSWISDLGNRIELNIWGADGVESTNIWITGDPEIVEEKRWSMESVMECCIRHELYTGGDTKAYTKMLQKVANSEPTILDLYEVAKDIEEHSEDQTIESVMFLLNRVAVTTTYTIQ